MTQVGRCEERIGEDGDLGEEEKMPQGVEGACHSDQGFMERPPRVSLVIF